MQIREFWCETEVDGNKVGMRAFLDEDEVYANGLVSKLAEELDGFHSFLKNKKTNPASVEVSAPEVAPIKKKAPTKKDKKPVEEERTYTLEEVQGALKALVQAKGSRDIPNQILKDIGGAEKLADVDASKYSAVMKEVAKCLK